jgi:hypothetical protein
MIVETARTDHSSRSFSERPNLSTAYLFAKSIIITAGYETEIDWQTSRVFHSITEAEFLREYAWVTLSAGMHEYVIRKLFPAISKCFYDWLSAGIIVEKEQDCRNRALMYFNNKQKINGIIETARIISLFGYNSFKERISIDPLRALQTLPFIGPVTCYHLAKNIGLPFAKPDRHLVRLANSVGYQDVQKFCEIISKQVNDSVPVVDIVLWRFATIIKNYIHYFYKASQEKEQEYIFNNLT